MSFTVRVIPIRVWIARGAAIDARRARQPGLSRHVRARLNCGSGVGGHGRDGAAR